MSLLLSVCVPCYNKARYLEKLIEALEPLSDIAEVCIFDNGSDDNPQQVITRINSKILIKFQRVDVTGPIDYSWFSALNMGQCGFKKLQLADDLPHAENIRHGLHLLQSQNVNSYILSSCSIIFENEGQMEAVAQKAWFEQSTLLRQKVAQLKTQKERANFAFQHYAFGNSLGDINGTIFRADSLAAMSALSQKYYLCLTHPDAEIFLNLLASGTAAYCDKPFSRFYSCSDSPMNRSRDDSDFANRVYTIPQVTQGLALLLDAKLRNLKSNADRIIYWKFVLRFIRRLIRFGSK
jgi:glycosyltransferase involved in cell wall biosynthesis